MRFLTRYRRTIRILASGILLFIVSAGSLAAFAWKHLNAPMTLPATVEFEVPEGASMARVSSLLADRGYLRYPRLLTLWARAAGDAPRIKAGVYEIEWSTSPRQMLGKLVSGETKQYQVTLVEGWTLSQALEAIWSSPRVIATLRGLSSGEIANRLGLARENPEGLFFPDTYYYEAATDDITLLSRANDRLDTLLSEAWTQRAAGLPFDSAYDALVLASIVEKETGVAEERRQIAGVFVRRLQQGMRLQSDPTVIYGLGERYSGNIDRAALDEATLYNTYRINGLPPTPIAMAGRESIEAVLDPMPGDSLYFVSRGDGTHYFSSNLEEHNEAVRRYQIDPQSAPIN